MYEDKKGVRPLGLGRKNYLFCGNHDAAEGAAVMYSLLGCCKAAEVNFWKWMVGVLSRIHDYDNDYSKDLAELLPITTRKIPKNSKRPLNVPRDLAEKLRKLQSKT